MRWATRKNMRSDRTASCWLITKFIDKNAEILFVSDEDINGLTEDGVLTFDAKDAKFKHAEDPKWGKFGDKCTFQTLMEYFGLNGKDPALDYMAKIIYAADIGHKKKQYDPREGYGVWAVTQGLSYLEEDDNKNIEFINKFFDSLYEYCKSVVK